VVDSVTEHPPNGRFRTVWHGVKTGGNKVGRMSRVSTDPFDVELQDDELLDEVELTANLIVAANDSEGRLSNEDIDRILGLS
jgi:hypothetical protein